MFLVVKSGVCLGVWPWSLRLFRACLLVATDDSLQQVLLYVSRCHLGVSLHCPDQVAKGPWCSCGLSSKSLKLPYNHTNGVSWNVTLFGNLLMPLAPSDGIKLSPPRSQCKAPLSFPWLQLTLNIFMGGGLITALQLSQMEDHIEIQWLNYVYTLGHKNCQEALKTTVLYRDWRSVPWLS